MAGDWIKLEVVTADKPEVYGIAEQLGIPPEHALGCLIRIWVWADEQSLDGRHVRTTFKTLDDVARTTGFAEAMQKMGWLTGQDGELVFPNFSYHNGKSAKRRAQKTKQKQVERSSSTDDKRATREEKRRDNPVVPFSDSFLAFWSAWPASERKGNKGGCWRLWSKRKLDAQLDAILRHIEMKKGNSWKEEHGKYIPAPIVFLNKSSWDGAEPPGAPQRGLFASP